MECFEARLDVVENSVGRFGERLQRMQEETVFGLKETVLEELLKEINISETRSEKARVVQAKKSTPGNCVPAQSARGQLPIFHRLKGDAFHLMTPNFSNPNFPIS